MNNRPEQSKDYVIADDAEDRVYETTYRQGTGSDPSGNVRTEKPAERAGRHVVCATTGDERREVDTTPLMDGADEYISV